jgi:uncharacterized membrane protein YfcA
MSEVILTNGTVGAANGAVVGAEVQKKKDDTNLFIIVAVAVLVFFFFMLYTKNN